MFLTQAFQALVEREKVHGPGPGFRRQGLVKGNPLNVPMDRIKPEWERFEVRASLGDMS